MRRGGENFEWIKAGLAPEVTRNNDSHLDLLDRQRAEQKGEFPELGFGALKAKRWPLGGLGPAWHCESLK